MPLLEHFNISSQMRDFDELCASDDLSLIALQEKVDVLDKNEIGYELVTGSCLHKICMNKNVTPEIIEYLLDIFPETVSIVNERELDISSESEEVKEWDLVAYPLHIACYNKDCTSSVIRLLLERYPPVLEQKCIVGDGINFYEYNGISGLPLHYYLARNCNVDADTVKLMVKTYPDSSIMVDPSCYPIHAAIINEHTNKKC